MADIRTCGDLADVLARFPRDMPVFLAADPEGNGFGRLAEGVEGMVPPDEVDYRPEQIFPTPEQAAAEPDPDYLSVDGDVRVLVLWPV